MKNNQWIVSSPITPNVALLKKTSEGVSVEAWSTNYPDIVSIDTIPWDFFERPKTKAELADEVCEQMRVELCHNTVSAKLFDLFDAWTKADE